MAINPAKIKMIAINTVTDGTGDHLPGTEFDCPDEETCKVLEGVNAAERVVVKAKKTSQASLISIIESAETIGVIDDLIVDEKRKAVLAAAAKQRALIEENIASAAKDPAPGAES